MSKAPAPAPNVEPIAIIGMACMFPQAPDLRAFWHNILAGVDAIGEPQVGWDAPRYLASQRISTQMGGWLKDLYRFDPREFGIMPNSLDGGEPDQFLALRVARDALLDAGYLRPDYDHRDTGIVLGHSTHLNRAQGTQVQRHIVVDQTLELLAVTCPHLDSDRLEQVRSLLLSRLPQQNADTAPSLVPNVMTGRIANRLNLRGPNYLLDAACSSSLLAVGSAIDELRAGRSRIMLAGGVQASLPAETLVIFTQLGALTQRGKLRPFEAGSDGTLLGEGLGVVVLKRASDALADGDRIYGLIRAVGQSSDGRATGLLAPSQDGETLAIRRAYDSCGVAPASIGLVEAHGTGIPLGDKTEIASLKAVFGGRDTPAGTKALGSVKSMISHCIPAAGIASLIKTTLALHHQVLPPTLCDEVNPELGIGQTPFYVNQLTAPWISRLGKPRRAAVNAFGFGGTNSHAVLEQAPAAARTPPRLAPWPAELCVLAADSADALLARLEALSASLARCPGWRLADVAATLAGEVTDGTHRMALVAKDLPSLARGIEQAARRLREGQGTRWATRGGVVYSAQPLGGQLAFLFPGEGSQYPAMFADLAMCFPVVQQWLDFWHGLYDLPAGRSRTDIVFPSSEIDAEQRKRFEQRLHDMDVGSEAVFIGGLAMHALLRSLGVEADVLLGHSSGESAALCAAGANPADTPAALADCIARHERVYRELLEGGQIATGALLAVGALPRENVDAQLAAAGGSVVLAMDNCANQIVLYGSVVAIAAIQKSLSAEGAICLPLPFDRGYHTPAFAAVSRAFLDYYKGIRLGRPKRPLYSCASADRFPDSAAGVRQLAAAQWSQPVRFRETVLRMHDDGVRAFVEVGPSAQLSAFVNDILIDREFLSVASNVRRRHGVEQLLGTLGQLWVDGRALRLERLFEGRAVTPIDLANDRPTAPRGVLLDNTMPVLRLTDADRALLRQLTAPPLAAAGPWRPATVSAGPPASAEPLPSEAGDARQADRERVMSGHFELMRSFLDQQRSLVEAWSTDAGPLPAEAAPAGSLEACTPFIDAVVEHDEQHLVARCTVSLEHDNFLRDHVMSGPVSTSDPGLHGLSCVPFTVSLEIMAEACALLAGSVDVRVIEHVQAFDWVALDDGELELEVTAEAIDRSQGRYRARVATARGTAVSAEFGFMASFVLPALAPLVSPRASILNHPNLYATGMFHGPVFQSVQQLDAWDDTGIDARLSPAPLAGFFEPGQTPALVLNPVLLDAMGQLVAYWFLQYVGTDFHSFPSTMGRIELGESCPADRPGLLMRARQQVLDGRSTDLAAPRAWQFECVDADGRVLMRGSDLVNVFLRVPTPYQQVRLSPLDGWLGAPSAAAPRPGVLLWEVPLWPEETCSLSGGIILRILAHAVLDAAERDEWRVLQGSVRRRREWLFGRAALKEAVRHWIHARSGQLLHPSAVRVLHDAHGAPFVDGAWRDRLAPAPAVSLSHNARACLVAVAGPEQAVGVDMEDLGRLRQPALVVGALAPSERALVHGLQGSALEERLLRLWCAKEAAAKALGLGLKGRPEAFCIVGSDPLFGSLRVEHEGATVHTVVTRDEETIIAVAWGEESGAENLG